MNSPPTRKLNRAWNPMTTECRVPSFGCDYRQNVKSPPNRDPAPVGDPKVHVGRIVPAVPSLHPNQRGTIRQSKTQTNMTAAQQNDRNKRSVSFVEPKTTEENGGGNHRHNSRSSPSPGPSGNSLRHTNLYDNFREMKPATSEDRAHWRHASAWNSPAQQPTFAGPSTNLSNPVFESIPVSSEPASDSQPKHYASAGQLDQTLTNLGLFNSQPPANPLYICSLPIQALQSEHLLPYQQQSVVGTTTTFVQQPVPLQPQVTIVATDPAALRAILMSAIPGQTMFQTPVTLPQSAHSSGPQYHAPGHSVQPVYHAPTAPSPVQPCNQNAIPMPPLHVVRPPVSTIAQQMSNESTTAQSIKQPAEKELSPHIPKSAQTEGYQRSGDRQTTTRPLQSDVLIQSRHTTKRSDQSVENIHPPCDVREQCQNIWHPPRTLRYRAQPELIENSLFADDGVKHNLSTSPNYREPKKLDPESFIHRARMDSGPREEAFDANTFPPPITTTPLNDPNSISAYYERLKRRSNRQVNAHRPKSTFIGSCHDEDKRRAHEQLKAPIVRQQTSTAEHETLGRNLSKPMKRAVTFSPDQIEIPKQSDQVQECSKQTGKDPSIMTVAERARRWIEGRQRDERQRYSTCGFIDQDLIDCDDIVTVEDRVKMFDSAISGRLDDQIPDRLQLVEAPTTLQSGSKTPQAKNGNTLVGKVSTPGKPYVLGNEPVVHKSSQSNHRLPASNTGGKLKDTVNKFEPNDPSNMSVGEKRRLFSQAGQSKTPGGRPVGRRKTQPVTLDDLARANELIVARLNGCDLDSVLSTTGDANEISGFRENASELSTPEASTLSEIRQIQASSESWRQRPHSFYGKESEPIPQVSQIRESLLISQETWKSRVEEKDNAEFTVKARLRQVQSKHSTTPERIRNATNKKLPISPINRATSKENRPTVKPIVQPQVPNVVPETVKQTVSVRPVDDEKFSHFFTTPTPLYESNAPVETTTSFPDLSTPATNGVLASDHNIVAQHRRAVRPERRKPQTIQSLAQLSTKPMEYEEIRPSAASNRTVPSVQRLLAPVNPSNRIAQEADERQARLAEAVLVGLGSREDFSGVKSNLRQLSDDLPLSQFQRQLLPYKSTMLLQIKGRRHVQVRLVCPSADSLNSGDCFLLVTTDAVYVWLGAFANVVEINKARELAVWVHKHRDLGYRGNQPEPIIIRENPKQVMENGHGRVQSSTSQFWNAMGYDQPQGIPASGTADEDELYESMIQCSNRVYEVTSEQLVPCESCWGSPLQYNLLSSAKAFVFDFGSEVYLWTGAQISPEIRLAGMELVQQVHAAPYDYTCCGMNPLNPLMTHSDIPPSDTSRPRWTLVGRVTEKGETILFKEKFIDWPDAARIGIELKVKSCQTKSGSAYSSIPPYPADELYQAAFNDPAPEPVLLTLDGRFVGRGGEGCRYEDGIPRRYRVETGQVQMWHVSEFSRSELPAVSHGQFFTEDTYVIRWPFRVMNVGMREVPSRAAEPKVNNEQCAYFFWQGSHSRVAEKGAAALMTVELDEERGPQLRVPEGQEPPAFCRLFNGRMIIHLGRRDSASAVHPHARMFFVHGEVPAEGHLIEVPPDVSSLRPQGAFLILQYHSSDYIESPVSVQRAWLWSGRLCPEANLTTAQYVVEQLKACCPPELAADLAVVNETHQTEADFGPSELLSLLNIEDYSSEQLCALVDCGLNALTLWQLGLASSSQLSARRITYPLQPDATLLGATPVQSQVQSGQTSPMDMAKALAERLRASSEAAFAMRQSNSQNRLAFPFSLRDLYEVPQPAFFLLVVGNRCVYVWQGWWRVRSSSRKNRRSPVFRRLSKSMMQHDEISLDDKPIDDDDDDDDESPTASDSEHSITGTAKGRFSALRRAVLKTAQELGKRIECEASVVYAGLEPPEFLSLFPPYERDAGAALYHQREEGKSDHQTDPVDDLLTSIESVRYTLAELQQRPLPDDLDATNLEMYLDDEAFESAFSMSREDFDQLPAWKKLDLKKRLNLF